MYHDFVYRVLHLRINPDCSHAIQKCCDYIELSLERKIRMADLAMFVGYIEYYPTEKFKKENGQSVSSHIRCVKVERAKVLLVSTELTIRDIAERLAFNSVNYFIQCFRNTMGYTPHSTGSVSKRAERGRPAQRENNNRRATGLTRSPACCFSFSAVPRISPNSFGADEGGPVDTPRLSVIPSAVPAAFAEIGGADAAVSPELPGKIQRVAVAANLRDLGDRKRG